MIIKRKIKNIIIICSILLLLIIVYLYSSTEKFQIPPLNTDVNQYNSTPIFTDYTFRNNTVPNTDTYNDTHTNTSEFMFALGPCLKIEITANNMNLLGIIVTGQGGNNIFNNSRNIDFVKIGKYITSSLPTTQTSTTNPDSSIVSNTNYSDLFMQAIGINNLSCDFNKNIKDSNNNIILRCFDSFWSEIESNMKTIIYDQILDSTKMFRTPDNTQTTLIINIPQAPSQPVITMPTDSPNPTDIIISNNNNHIGNIVLYKPYIPIQTNSSNFININSNEKFLDIPPVSINTAMLSSGFSLDTTITTSSTTSPNTTSPNTTSPNTTIPNTTSPNTTSPNTTSPHTNTTLPNTSTTSPKTKELKEHLYKIPNIKLFQSDFNGSSNIYSPYIYY